MEAKFKVLSSRELTATTPDPNPELLGMIYDIQLDDADGVMVQYRVSVTDGAQYDRNLGDIWSITTFGVTGHNIDHTSRFGKKIVDFAKQGMVSKPFIESDDSGSRRFSEQNFS